MRAALWLWSRHEHGSLEKPVRVSIIWRFYDIHRMCNVSCVVHYPSSLSQSNIAHQL